MIKLNTIFLLIASLSVFGVYAENGHERRSEPFKFIMTDSIKQEQYVENYTYVKIQNIYSEKHEKPIESIKVPTVDKQLKTDSIKAYKSEQIVSQNKYVEFDNLKWFNVGLDQFEYVSQLRELMTQARMYHAQKNFTKEKELSDAFSKLLLITDAESADTQK